MDRHKHLSKFLELSLPKVGLFQTIILSTHSKQSLQFQFRTSQAFAYQWILLYSSIPTGSIFSAKEEVGSNVLCMTVWGYLFSNSYYYLRKHSTKLKYPEDGITILILLLSYTKFFSSPRHCSAQWRLDWVFTQPSKPTALSPTQTLASDLFCQALNISALKLHLFQPNICCVQGGFG